MWDLRLSRLITGGYLWYIMIYRDYRVGHSPSLMQLLVLSGISRRLRLQVMCGWAMVSLSCRYSCCYTNLSSRSWTPCSACNGLKLDEWRWTWNAPSTIDKFEDLWCCPQQRLLLDHHLQYLTSSWPLTQEVLQGGDAASASLKLAQVS